MNRCEPMTTRKGQGISRWRQAGAPVRLPLPLPTSTSTCICEDTHMLYGTPRSMRENPPNAPEALGPLGSPLARLSVDRGSWTVPPESVY